MNVYQEEQLTFPEIFPDSGKIITLRKDREILIIDDDYDFRLSLSELLSLQGYKILTAKNGRDALEYLISTQDPPELIILDLNMPEENGICFWNNLNEHRELCHIPTIVISGFIPNPEQLIGIKSIITKPIDRLELLNTIETIFKKYEL